MPGGGGVTGLRVAILKAAGHALEWMLRQRPGCCAGVEEGSWDPPCSRSRGPAACTCGGRQERQVPLILATQA